MAQKRKKLKARRIRPRTGRRPGRRIKGTLKRTPANFFDILLDQMVKEIDDLFGKPKSKSKKSKGR